jgi:hypothetical protein
MKTNTLALLMNYECITDHCMYLQLTGETGLQYSQFIPRGNTYTVLLMEKIHILTPL